MAWTVTADLDTFRTTADSFLHARPDRNTVLLSVVAALSGLGTDVYGDLPPLYGWWHAEDGEITGAFLRTPPYPVALSPMSDEAAAALPAALAEDGRAGPDGEPAGVRGPERAAEAFAAEQGRRTGARPRVTDRERLFRLGTLVPPSPAPAGGARLATAADRGMLLKWFAAFREDAGLLPADDARLLDARIAERRLILWEAGGRPVSMAATSPAASSAVRVGPVYTPLEHRGRGYGGAATAAMTQAYLDAGVRAVLLFTDLANPTSNALYQRLGYVPLEDHVTYGFAGGR